jgi:AraC-like DNA-binding protein
MIAYPGAHNLDVVGPLEILATTAYFSADGTRPYDIAVVAERRPVRRGKLGPDDHRRAVLRGCAGRRPRHRHADDRGRTRHFRGHERPGPRGIPPGAAPRARRIASICTGALVLAEAGLLDGRRASTHWFWCPKLETDYPGVQVDRDAIYVRDGNVWTSAGVTSGMDLALALVEDDLGHEAALQVARFSVMYMMRPGGQSQFSAHLVAQRAEDPAINATLDFILANPGDPLTVTALAARAGLSERTFARRFKDETGMTPASYVETARVQAARVALETTAKGVEQVAIGAGFQNAERMRRAFQRHLGVSASEYRERFRGSPEAQALIRDGPG